MDAARAARRPVLITERTADQGDSMSYRLEWFPAAYVAFVALSALLALAAAIAATPYLLFRSVRARWAQPVLIRGADNSA